MLPAILRIHSIGGWNTNNRTRAAAHSDRANTSARPVRAMAITRQSTCGPNACASAAITANAAAPQSIHKYGSDGCGGSRGTAG
jgi:hypothetical protein